MSEFAFELALSAHLEQRRDAILSRQLGASVHGRRVLDTVLVEPGPDFAKRAAITSETIPPAAIEGPAGPGRARHWKAAVDTHPERARDVVERALDIGFFERERATGQLSVRQTTRYPDRWFDRIVGIENKPDLATPGALETQLLTDVELALVDDVVLATESHVTGAHLNRIPEEVGVWEFDPETGKRKIIREPTPLPTDESGVEIIERDSARTEIRIATAEEKRRARRRVAERAYGKGWRTLEMPACGRVDPENGLPYCPYHERIVRPASDCGEDCGGYDPADPPESDANRLRGARTPWDPNPAGRRRRQSGLDRYVD